MKIPLKQPTARPRPKATKSHHRPPSAAQPNNGRRRSPNLHHSSKYDPKFCQMLIEHMEQGGSFETFGGLDGLRVTRDTIRTWRRRYPEFGDAAEIGLRLSQSWWERLGQAIAVDDPSYQLEALGVKPFLKERTTRMIEGGPVLEVKEKYHVPRGNVGAWVFNMKNRFGWKDAYVAEHTGLDGGPIQHEHRDLTGYSTEVLRLKRQELLARRQLLARIEEENAKRNEVIDVTPTNRD